MGLNAQGFRQVIQAPGMASEFRWLRATPCSCYDSAENTFILDCVADCRKGIVYSEQVVPDAVKLLVTTLKEDLMTADFGFLARGSMICKYMPDDLALGYQDRIILTERRAIGTETVKRGDDKLDQLHPHELLAVTYQPQAAGTDPTEYNIGEACRLSYTAGADNRYTVDWVGAVSPPADAIYGVRYAFAPQYFFLPATTTIPPQALGGTLPQTGQLTRDLPGEM